MGRLAYTIVLVGFALVLACGLSLAGDRGAVAAPAIDILLDAAQAIDMRNLEKDGGVSKDREDAIKEGTKGAITRLAAMRNTSIEFGGLVRNVFFDRYFVALYDAKINGAKGAIGLLWGDVRLLTSVMFTGEDLTDVQDALRKGPASLRMVLRDYYLTRHVDIDPSLSIVDQLATISLDAATNGIAKSDIAHIDLLPANDKERAAAYIGHTYGKAIKILNLKENVRLGLTLISMYDADIDNLPTGAVFFFYRQTDEGIFLPLRDPAATWRATWLEHILHAGAETKRLLLTDMLRDICIDPNLPRPVVDTSEAVRPSIEEQSPPTFTKDGE
ncbi:MAG TPA: hypothetical protein VLW86_03625 [Syntrophorhabdales bacterium]|nr:hypothetical protein [Syntrophorhabdales bacterium]